ncbi:MAG TPA: hypothetical protein VMM60_16285 [Ilumatobacter sp.]|nr:hypothetical protein [Ilumatobacter sp.]
MPWCEDCAKYWAPTALTVDGTCPTCGRPVGEPERTAAALDESTPWHFKLLVAMVVVYLGWRFVQLLA